MKHLIILCIALLLFACDSQPVLHQNNETIWDPWNYEPTVTINQLTELNSKLKI